MGLIKPFPIPVFFFFFFSIFVLNKYILRTPNLCHRWKEAILRHGQKAEAFEVAFGKGTTADTAKSGNHSESAASPAVAQMKKKARHRKNVDDGQIGRANEGVCVTEN